MNNSILCLSDLGGFRVFWPLKCLTRDQMRRPLDPYLRSHLISSLYTHIHMWLFELRTFYVLTWCVCGHGVECEGWTVTCWWWVTYCSTYEHVSNIPAGQGRGYRTAQLLNHLRSFSHQHTPEDQHTVGTAFWPATRSHHTQLFPEPSTGAYRCRAVGENKARGLRLKQQLWKYLGWPRWCKQCDRLQTFSRCA